MVADTGCLVSFPKFPTKKILSFLWGIRPIPMLGHVV